MRTGPRTLRGAAAAAPDYHAKAIAGWGEPPDWILALAAAAARKSAAAVAKRLGYSPSVVSQALANAYPGDLDRLEQVVRGALMDLRVDCPVLGGIGRDRCLSEQKEPFRATSSHRARLYHACNTPGRCRHSTATARANAEAAALDDGGVPL